MKPILSIFTLALVLLSSCNGFSPVSGDANIVTSEFDYADFTEIDVSHSFDVELVQSDEYKVRVSCNENFQEYLDVTNEDGVLSVSMKSGHSYMNSDLSAKISVPSIEKIDASGASSVELKKFKLENLDIDLSGASEIKGKVTVNNKLTIDASGASNVDLEGRVKDANMEFSGASEMDSKKLIVSNLLEIDCSGASDVVVKANGKIKAELSGASSLDYYGKGELIEKNISGASSIKSKGEDVD